MTILVTGSRGAVAKSLLSLLRDNGFTVRSASRNPEQPDVLKCDLSDPSTFPAALDGVTSVFLYAEASHTEAFVKEAASAGVEHIVLLSTASVVKPGAEHDQLAKSHLDVERALSAGPVESTFLRPGSFAGNALAWTWPIKSTGVVNLPYPNSHTDPIHELDVAEAAFAVLIDPSLRGRGHVLSGPESLTFQQQIDQLAEATGRPITVNPVTREEWKREMADYVPDAFADSLLDWWRSNDDSPVPTTGTVEELTGHPARSFAQWATDHAADFRS